MSMLPKAFNRINELFDEISKEADKLFREGSISMQTASGVTVINRDGNIEIKGPMKELRINGKLVRFK